MARPSPSPGGTPSWLSDNEMEQLVQENSRLIDAYFDPHYAESLDRNIFQHIDSCYFRTRYIGFEDQPDRRSREYPLIYIGNHSGMAFPWDAAMFSAGLFRRAGYDMRRAARALVAPPLVRIRLMNAFLVRHFWRRGGGVEASTLNFETMMGNPDAHVLIYPEGVAGIGKGFNKRYRLQRFATSFVRMSLKYKTEVIPVYTVNGEYINPFVFSLKPVNWLTSKIGIPFLPIGPVTLLLPFFPWLFYFAFPAQLTYVQGKAIRPWTMTDKSFSEMTRADFQDLAVRIREQMQLELDAAVSEYGKHPYRWGSLFKQNLLRLSQAPFFFAPGWPLLFAEHERVYQAHKKAGGSGPVNFRPTFLALLRALIRNPIALTFFIPVLGWIPIFLLGYKE